MWIDVIPIDPTDPYIHDHFGTGEACVRSFIAPFHIGSQTHVVHPPLQFPPPPLGCSATSDALMEWVIQQMVEQHHYHLPQSDAI